MTRTPIQILSWFFRIRFVFAPLFEHGKDEKETSAKP
jgi:hypothetical protein